MPAVDVRHPLEEESEAFVASGRPMPGIGNGFQALVKAGFFGPHAADGISRGVVLTHNENGDFACCWVTLVRNPRSACLCTCGLEEPIIWPVVHGEGRF